MSDSRKYFFVDSPLYKLEYTARVCALYFSRFFKESFAHLDITIGEFQVMDTIVRSPEISQIELARLLFKGRSHVTQILNSLERKNYIKRIDEVKNKRKIRRTLLTEEGENIYNQIKSYSESRKKFSRMTDYFEEKEETFVGILSEIQEILTEGETVTFD